ncbi:MAG: bifunctional alpha,alpha-trehalose-phosphate synthase (UDP-forming)/trehalose-phosphatase, partial [bacterium]
VKSELYSKYNAYPIFLTEEAMDKFYLGFCNRTIWPLFHYFPSFAVYEEEYWDNYKSVNETFCDSVMDIIKEDDIVWIHDYHLMLLPKLIREKMPDIKIGFFLHIPFPTFEIFRLLPKEWSADIIKGLLGSDLIGFHIYDYTQYFLRCVLRILGYEHNMGEIITNERIIKADTFPMGIDFNKYYNAAKSQEVEEEIRELKKTFPDVKIVLSIDRLDYSKGIINRLKGFELFLQKYPEWHKKIILAIVVVPSRIGVPHYDQMKHQIDEVIGKVNGKFGSLEWTPILYQYKNLQLNQLVALYRISDVALVTPLRDGMNLVAKEYIAASCDKTGVLILSDMAGASNELGEAIIINPNNVNDIAAALKQALEMPEHEQINRNKIMQTRLKRYDVIRWAEEFLKELNNIKELQNKFATKILSNKLAERLLNNFVDSNKRIIFLDYDGTLVPIVSKPELAVPNEEINMILKKICELPNTDVVLISGRAKNTLQTWFGNLNINFIAEHGAWLKHINNDWETIKPLKNDWKKQIIPILEIHTDRLPGSFIEEKEYSIVWHYRRSDPELASIRAKELADYLVNFTANIDIQVLRGSKVIELRNSGINKGNAAIQFLSKNEYDFILAIGDDWTDEDLFKNLPEKAYSIRVGLTQSYARFNFHNYIEVIQLLKRLINTGK